MLDLDQLQGLQRRPRPPGRRPAAEGGDRRLARRAAPVRPPRSLRGRGVQPDPPRLRACRGGSSRRAATGCDARGDVLLGRDRRMGSRGGPRVPGRARRPGAVRGEARRARHGRSPRGQRPRRSKARDSQRSARDAFGARVDDRARMLAELLGLVAPPRCALCARECWPAGAALRALRVRAAWAGGGLDAGSRARRSLVGRAV